MRKTILFVSLILALTFSAAACRDASNAAENSGTEKLKIFTSFYPMHFIAKEIAQDKAEIMNMIPAGVEPHDWEPTLKIMAQLQESDIFIYNGAGMERWADRVIKNLDLKKTKVVEASKGIELIRGEDEEDGEAHGHDENDNDPHVWVSPVNLKKEAANVLDALIEKDGKNEAFYKENYDKLSKSLISWIAISEKPPKALRKILL